MTISTQKYGSHLHSLDLLSQVAHEFKEFADFEIKQIGDNIEVTAKGEHWNNTMWMEFNNYLLFQLGTPT